LLHRLRSQGLFCIGKTVWLVAEKARHNKTLGSALRNVTVANNCVHRYEWSSFKK
jgi:hypothetical protein